MARLADLPVGSAFRVQFGTAPLTGIVLDKSPSCVSVQLDRVREVVIDGEVKGRSRERTTWSHATEVEPVPVCR